APSAADARSTSRTRDTSVEKPPRSKMTWGTFMYLQVLPDTAVTSLHHRSVRGRLDHDEVGVVGADGATALEVLHVEAGEPLGQLCEPIHVVGTVEKLGEARLEVVVAGDHVEDGPVRDNRLPPPGELGRVGKAVRLADDLHRSLLGRELADATGEDARDAL